MRKPVLHSLVLIAALLGAQHSMAAPKTAAEVLYLSGEVKANGAKLSKGDTVPVGATIETSSDGHVYLQAVDGGFLVVRSASKAVIQSYSTENPADVQIKIELISGTARSVTGTAAQKNKAGFRFNTPVAAIGVRGTDFTVKTNDNETLVSVSSGAVAVAPLGDTCLATGFGPCQGDFVADLSANDKGFLRVVRGAKAPELILDPAGAPTAPIPGEKTSKTGTQPELSPVYEENLRNGVLVMAGAAGQPGQNTSSISWGRWQAVADQEPNSALFRQVANDGKHTGLRILGPYFLASQVDRPYSRPVENSVVFTPTASEAFLGRAGSTLTRATVSQAELKVDFNQREFNTRFTVANEQGSTALHALGSIGPAGTMEGDIIQANAKVVGLLEGNGAKSASTLFNTFGGGEFDASGFIRWGR